MTIPTYALMAMIGLIVASLYLLFRLETVNLTFKGFLIYLIIGIMGLLLFSRILFVISEIPNMDTYRPEAFLDNFLHGGIVFYGGMLGLLLTVYIITKVRKDNTRDILEFIAPAIPLFHGFARIGCLLTGCCYGIPWSWGVIMAETPDVVRFPVQLVESLCDFIIFFMIQKLKKKGCNRTLEVYLFSYAVCRFVLEFFRGDEIRGLWWVGISTSQIVSLIIMVVVAIRFVKSRKQNGSRETKSNESVEAKE